MKKLIHISAMTIVLVPLLAVGGGCALWGSSPTKVDYARPFPKGLGQGAVADVQVFRRTSTLEFTNTTAKQFAKGTMWLNGRFSRPIDGIAVGQSISIPLNEFRDEYGEPFRAGGFFASEKPDTLVLCQVEESGEGSGGSGGKSELIGFVVVFGLPD